MAACGCNCCEACIAGALDAAKLRALDLIDRWVSAGWRSWSIHHSQEPNGYVCTLTLGEGSEWEKYFYGATQHDAMAQCAQYLAGLPS